MSAQPSPSKLGQYSINVCMDAKSSGIVTGDGSWFTQMMSRRECNATRFICATSGNCIQPATLQEFLTVVESKSNSGHKGICVIENASPQVVQSLIDKWQIDEAFFKAHASNRTILKIWTDRRTHDHQSQKWRSLEGVYIQYGVTSNPAHSEKVRTSYWDREVLDQLSENKLSNNTRVSYCKIIYPGWCKSYHSQIYVSHCTDAKLDLFLVDNNQWHQKTVSGEYSALGRVIVRFPAYSKFSGGLAILLNPADNSCNLFNALMNCLHHIWSMAVLLDNDIIAHPQILLYVFTTATAEHSLRRLRSQIRQVSFHAIRTPGVAITDTLHDARENMANMRDSINEMFHNLGDSDRKLFEELSLRPGDVSMQDFMSRMDSLVARGKELHEFFFETLQIIGQTISIRDVQYSMKQAEESLEQTKQATMLTRLAAIYLPLSVATGIFGMNLREINGSTPKVWMFIVTLVGLALFMVVSFIIPTYVDARREKRCKCSKA